MNLKKDGHHSHRGVIGMEAAIVLIAFVIVAAALAFVVLNMGFSTTQKAKTSIVSTLTETSSSIEISGKVVWSSDVNDLRLNVTLIPIKIAPGGGSVNLVNTTVAVKYFSNSASHDDIYAGTLNEANSGNATYTSLRNATNAAFGVSTGDFANLDNDPFIGGNDADSDDWPVETTAFVYWTVQSEANEILDQGEHAVLGIAFTHDERPQYLDKMRIELILAGGSSLTIERTVPSIINEVVDLS